MAEKIDRESIKLVEYVNQLFKDWASKREEREKDWQRNLDDFLGENSENWKKKDAERKDSKENWRSNVVVRVLKRKVIAAWVFITDTILQGGQIPFMLVPTKGTYDEANSEAVQDAAKAMEDEIRGQLAECQAERIFTKAILHMGLYGGTWLKTPVLKKKLVKKWVKNYAADPQQVAMAGGDPEQFATYQREVYEKKILAVEHKSVWNMFPDPEVAPEDVQDGRGIIERTPVSAYELQQLKKVKGYDSEAIDEVISRNRGTNTLTGIGTLPPHLRNITNRGKTILYKEFWGRVPRAYISEEPQAMGTLPGSPAKRFDIIEDVEHSGDDVEVMLAIADDILIRLHVNEDGERPYRYLPWELSPDDSFSTGCADNLTDVQKMVTGGVRNFADNKALSGNVETALVGGALRPGQSMERYPGKVWEFEEGTNVSQSFAPVVTPDVGDSLLTMISLFEKIGDEDSGIPTIMQGDTRPKQKADTATEMTMLMQNAGKYIGQVIRNVDEYGIEPTVLGYYNYNMMRDDLDPSMMGDYEVHALGFNSFFSKSTLLAAMLRFLEIIRTDPNAQQMVKFKTIYEKIAKTLDLDPDELVYTDEELAERQQMQAQQQAELMQQQQAMQMEANAVQAQQQAGLEAEKAKQQAAIQDEAADNQLERDLVKSGHEATMDERRARIENIRAAKAGNNGGKK